MKNTTIEVFAKMTNWIFVVEMKKFLFIYIPSISMYLLNNINKKLTVFFLN